MRVPVDDRPRAAEDRAARVEHLQLDLGTEREPVEEERAERRRLGRDDRDANGRGAWPERRAPVERPARAGLREPAPSRAAATRPPIGQGRIER